MSTDTFHFQSADGVDTSQERASFRKVVRFPRTSGILLHPTSLPGPHGIGDLGKDAFQFVDFLAENQQQLWQVLPLNPPGMGESPYGAFSAFAGNPLLISLGRLVEMGLLAGDQLASAPGFPAQRVDYVPVRAYKLSMLQRACDRLNDGASGEVKSRFEAFRAEHAEWLDDFALFMALKDAHHGESWINWERPLVTRQPQALEEAWRALSPAIRYHQSLQFIFFTQWLALKRYANQRGVQIIGDMPIFVAHDSADVWSHQELFNLDERGMPKVVAGVPPDYFSSTGQRWGNPLYRWDKLAQTGYDWWVKRFRTTLATLDVTRVDHFRGFESYWEVPAEHETAVNGRWVKGPGMALFDAAESVLGRLPIIVEDLGLITPAVEKLREALGYPGMKVLQFAFDSGPSNPYLPHNYEQHYVVYTGTHDNDTTVGWFSQLSPKTREAVLRYLGTQGRDISREMIRLAFSSVADMAIVPIQDLLGLGSEARMNYPGQAMGNWAWRLAPGQLTSDRAGMLRELTELFGRSPSSRANRDGRSA